MTSRKDSSYPPLKMEKDAFDFDLRLPSEIKSFKDFWWAFFVTLASVRFKPALTLETDFEVNESFTVFVGFKTFAGVTITFVSLRMIRRGVVKVALSMLHHFGTNGMSLSSDGLAWYKEASAANQANPFIPY